MMIENDDFSQYDNDGDGDIDYFIVFWTGPGGERGTFWWGQQPSWDNGDSREICGDGRDNDCDGIIDCPSSCVADRDNDGDVDGTDARKHLGDPPAADLKALAKGFGRSDCF